MNDGDASPNGGGDHVQAASRHRAVDDTLVWYPGAPAVEGYTNPLWTLLMAGFHAAGLSAGTASLAVMITSAVLVVCAALLAMHITAEIAGEHGYAALAAGVITGLFTPLLFWSLRGMEVGLFTMLVLAALIARELLIATIASNALAANAATTDRALMGVVLVAILAVLARAALPASRPKRPGSRAPAPAGSFALITIALIMAMNAPVVVDWLRAGPPHAADDAYAARYGELLNAITTDNATIAVVWAGAPAYYSRRRSIDLLGKNDALIAHEPPHTEEPFHPGHDKWDFDHSIRDLKPDVVAQMTIGPGEAYLPTMRDLGYVQVRPIGAAAALAGPGPPLKILMARRDSPNVRWDLVEVLN